MLEYSVQETMGCPKSLVRRWLMRLSQKNECSSFQTARIPHARREESTMSSPIGTAGLTTANSQWRGMSMWGWWERSQVSGYNYSMCLRRIEEESPSTGDSPAADRIFVDASRQPLHHCQGQNSARPETAHFGIREKIVVPAMGH